MNKRIYIVAAVITLLGAVALWAVSGSAPPATAATGEPHPEHAHGHQHEGLPDNKGDLDRLFEEEEHEEAEHGHAESKEGETHAGHGHAEEASDHAGHGDHDGICPEHRVPEAEDALCHGDHLGELQPGEGMLVRLASPEVAGKAGIGVTRAQPIVLATGVELHGTAEFNRTRIAQLASPAAGTVRRVRTELGAKVARGTVLVELSLPEVAALKAQLAAARARQAQAAATYERERDLLARGISSRQEFDMAEAEHRAAQSAVEQYRQQMESFGLPAAATDRVERGGDGGAGLDLRAPFAGTVVSVQAAAGETAVPGTPLVTIADTASIWIELAFPEAVIHKARNGAPVEARFAGLPGQVFSGQVFQVGAALDERTRTLPVLAEVKNPEGRLKAGMFGTVRLLSGEEETVLAIPADALQTIDGLPFLFVRRQPDLFELRRVQAGGRMAGMVPILFGLAAGEDIVASQGFALKSEVLKARLGASCADH